MHSLPQQPPELRYTVEWSRFQEPVRETLLRPKFVLLSKDDPDTSEFLQSCYTDVSVIKDISATLLRSFGFMSLTDANAYTNRGHMFVLSLDQLKQLVPGMSTPVTLAASSTEPSGHKELSLLDIGAGDGGITERISPGFGRIVATETSLPMLKKLRRKGWEAYAPEELPQEPEAFDVIMCLNVLDRADKPVSLLKSLQPLLKKNGVLVLAVVLPWCPFVESGNKQLPPTEKLDMHGAACRDGASFEKSMQRLLESTILPLGYALEKWTRLPYISQGDTKCPYYVLSDAVFVLSVADAQSALIHTRASRNSVMQLRLLPRTTLGHCLGLRGSHRVTLSIAAPV